MLQVKSERIIASAALGVLSILLATGCSASISASRVAEESSTMLTSELGQEPDDFTCDERLPAEVGAEIRCVIEIDGETIDATVTVTEVDGNEVQWEIRTEAP
ncbi:DUF4333 domain-containing protein [Nocardiopsis valliformis]|uniref:DUF4333 domain-containing protein n=1 Tax=Nocardiopsis valliformis TaxID=239974 RepID=UPI000346B664|nr:DUF4333 domain-containing protein [Nocardiopsis valliformis]